MIDQKEARQPTIVCKKIVKHFGNGTSRVTTLMGVDFIAYPGEIIMLMGPSGSGKTTLISIIGGILDQDEGECLVLGRSMAGMSEREKIAFRGEHFGFMYQYFNLVPTLTAQENTAIPLLLKDNQRAAALTRADELLVHLGLNEQRYRFPGELSGGEQQRVCIARACIHKPTIILCDEPTSFLDLERGQKIMQLLQAIRDETQCTIIVVTHDPRILGFADRIVAIEDGKIVESGYQKGALV